jgi:hypothetical protein
VRSESWNGILDWKCVAKRGGSTLHGLESDARAGGGEKTKKRSEPYRRRWKREAIMSQTSPAEKKILWIFVGGQAM